MKTSDYKQAMSFLLNPKHLSHDIKIIPNQPYIPEGILIKEIKNTLKVPIKAAGTLLEKTFIPLTVAETGYKSILEGENPIRALTEAVIPGAETILHHKDVINNLSPEGKKVYQQNIEDEARNQYSYVEGIPQQIEQRSPEEILKTQSELSKHMEEAEQKTQEQKEQKIKDTQEKLKNIPDSMDYNTPIGAAKGGLIND